MSSINLRPRLRQFPFDETCSELVSLLEQREFNIPGIEIGLSEYGRGQYKMVSTVEGSDFRLWFCRQQARLGEWNDIAAISDITIEDISISVYSDGSGPSLNIYVGDDLHNNIKWWLRNTWDVNAKLLKRPRKCIGYKGASSPSGKYSSGINKYLVHNDDLDRAYSPEKLKKNQIPHHSHDWSIDKNVPLFDVPHCVLINDVFHWVNEKLKKRLTIIRES